jgi:hypothetical protein
MPGTVRAGLLYVGTVPRFQKRLDLLELPEPAMRAEVNEMMVVVLVLVLLFASWGIPRCRDRRSRR